MLLLWRYYDNYDIILVGGDVIKIKKCKTGRIDRIIIMWSLWYYHNDYDIILVGKGKCNKKNKM